MEKNKGKIIGEIKNSKGITLLALAVTIVVLLILTGIGIKLALGNNGIIGEAKNAKEQTEIDEEKGIVKRATTVSLIKSKGSRVEQDTLEKALNDETGEGKTEVSDAGDVFEILFTDSDRYYEVDSEGNISDVNKITKDEYAGDITKGGRCDGSEEKPYEISCIEDLVILANRTNGKGNYIDENGEVKDVVAVTQPFKDKNFILTKTLNFESKFSYSKPELKWTYDSENDAYKIDDLSTTTLQEIITDKTGVGFVPIGPDTGSGDKMFWGNLEGQNNMIKNLYENRTESAGFFGALCRSTIKNLRLSGNIKASSVGVFSYIASGGKFYNCSNLVNIEADRASGFASEVYGNITLINCINEGNDMAGGLIRWDDVNGTTTIVNCYNSGVIKGSESTSSSHDYASGIMGGSYSSGTRNIINTCSLGKITNYGNNFYYAYGGATVDLTNCFYPSSMTKNNSNVEVNEGSISFDDSNVQEVVNTLNAYVKEHKNDYEVPLKEWKIGTVNGEKVPVLIDD